MFETYVKILGLLTQPPHYALDSIENALAIFHISFLDVCFNYSSNALHWAVVFWTKEALPSSIFARTGTALDLFMLNFLA